MLIIKENIDVRLGTRSSKEIGQEANAEKTKLHDFLVFFCPHQNLE
jgi:hypothetical protein